MPELMVAPQGADPDRDIRILRGSRWRGKPPSRVVIRGVRLNGNYQNVTKIHPRGADSTIVGGLINVASGTEWLAIEECELLNMRMHAVRVGTDPAIRRNLSFWRLRDNHVHDAFTGDRTGAGVLIDDAALRQIGELARDAGARVLVDEVYLEAMFENAPRSSVHLGPEFIATSSLTKGYGLSGLRCGWILAEPKLAEQMRRLDDIFGATPPHAMERLSVVALARLEKIAARAKTI